MKVKEIAEKLNLVACNIGEDREVESVYCGDFLSHAISKQDESAVWLTVMANVNVMGVASLCDTAMIILCDGTTPDDGMNERAKQMDVSVYSTKQSIYQVAVQIHELTKL